MKNYFEKLENKLKKIKNVNIKKCSTGSVYIKQFNYNKWYDVYRISDHVGTDYDGMDIVNEETFFINKYQYTSICNDFEIDCEFDYKNLKIANKRLLDYVQKKLFEFEDYLELKIKLIEKYSNDKNIKEEIDLIGKHNLINTFSYLHKNNFVTIPFKYHKFII
jgi:hypothetical protein